MRGIKIRFLGTVNSNDRISEYIAMCMAETHATVEEIRAVEEIEIYEEGILPPIITLFCNMEIFSLNNEIERLAVIFDIILKRLIESGIDSYTNASGKEDVTSDFGLFLNVGEKQVKYYFRPKEYNATAMSLISETLNKKLLINYIKGNTSRLGIILFWKKDNWCLFHEDKGMVPV
ncbi:MAG TPA: hypothetical protein ENJ08_12895 [Gammaproteobacteria bacterium]|nr:hypothetical protein [Gammaproteobacteria bacterium]